MARHLMSYCQQTWEPNGMSGLASLHDHHGTISCAPLMVIERDRPSAEGDPDCIGMISGGKGSLVSGRLWLRLMQVLYIAFFHSAV